MKEKKKKLKIEGKHCVNCGAKLNKKGFCDNSECELKTRKGFVSSMIEGLDKLLEKKSKEKKTCGCNKGEKSCCS